MSNLLEKASILLTPTAYDDGKILSVKPSIVLGEELVVNGDFQNNVDSWSNGNSGVNTWVNGHLVCTGTGGSYAAAKQIIQAVANKKYLITGQIARVSGSFQVGIEVNDSNGSGWNIIGSKTTSSEFVTVSEIITTNTGTTQLDLRATIFNPSVNNTNSLKLDNVSVKEVLDADFQFTRNSSATRVNSQGLIEDMQILSGDLVSNGDFSQEGSELVTNGDFSNGQISWSVSGANATHIATFNGDTLRYQSDTTSPQLIVAQGNVLVVGKIYKITIDVKTLTSGSLKSDSLGGLNITPSVGVNTFYATATGTTFNITRATTNVDISIDNVSVKEVGQDWNFGGGWSMGNGVAESDSTPASYLGQEGVILTTNPYELTFQARLKSGTNGTVTALIGGSNSKQFTILDTNWQTFTYENTRLPSSQTGIYFNNDGNEIEITNVSVVEITDDTNLPRIDYSPYSGAGTCGHWLFEPQSTQLVPYSEDFTASASQWTTGGNTTIESGYLAPDGTNNAYKLSGTDSGLYYPQVPNLNTNSTRSIYARTVTGTGTVNLMSYGGNTNNNFTITEQWQRFELTGSNSTGVSNFYAVDFRFPSVNPLSEVILWGANATNDQNFATSYIPTSGSTVTRNQEEAFGAGNSDLINSTEGVLYFEGSALADDGTNRFISLTDGSNDNRILFGYRAISNQIFARIEGNNSASVDLTTVLSNTEINAKIAISYDSSYNYKMFVNGFLVDSGVGTDSIVGLDRLDFTNASGIENFYGKTKALAVFKEALTDDELECLTSDETSFSSFNALALANNYTII